MAADAYVTARDRVAGEYTFTIRKKDGAILTVLSTLTLTLTLQSTGAFINGRNKQNALNAANVTFVNGVVTWSIQPLDNALVGDADEVHVALFEWSAPGEDDFHELAIAVPNTRVRP